MKIKWFFLTLMIAQPLLAQGSAGEDIKSKEEKQLYHMMAFEAAYNSGLKCRLLKKSEPKATDVDSHDLAILLQVTDIQTVTRKIEGGKVKLRMHMTANKSDLKKKKMNFPLKEIFIDVVADAGVATPKYMMFDVVAVEEGYVTDRFVECQ